MRDKLLGTLQGDRAGLVRPFYITTQAGLIKRLKDVETVPLFIRNVHGQGHFLESHPMDDFLDNLTR